MPEVALPYEIAYILTQAVYPVNNHFQGIPVSGIYRQNTAPFCLKTFNHDNFPKQTKKMPPADHADGIIYCASKPVSRVLYLTVIYLDEPLPIRSSHPGSGRASLGETPCSHTGVAPDRVYSVTMFPCDG